MNQWNEPQPCDTRGRNAGRASLLAMIALLLAPLHVGCERTGPVPAAAADDADARPVVIVSVLPQASIVERLAGDLVEVQAMVPPGASPELYEPTIEQMRAVEDAAMYITVGHPHMPFESTWLSDLLNDRPELRTVDGFASVEQREDDPHMWVSPRAMKALASNVSSALIERLPDERPAIEANLNALHADIDALDADLRAILEPHRGRRFVVFHPAWGYFAADYGLEQVALEHEHKEPTPHHVHEVVDLAKSEGIRVVFVQPQFSTHTAEAVAAEIGGRVVTADPLAPDWMANLREIAAALREAFES